MAVNDFKKEKTPELNPSGKTIETEKPPFKPEIEVFPDVSKESETKFGKEKKAETESGQIGKRPAGANPTPQVEPVVIPKDEEVRRVEAILEQDLSDIYFSMPPAAQAEFKARGEETAIKIVALLHKTKVKAAEIFRLIFEWLKIIPGVSKIFIKQEAKIKTARVLKIKK